MDPLQDALDSLADSYFTALPWLAAFTLLIWLLGPSVASLFAGHWKPDRRKPLGCDPGLDRISRALGRYRGSDFHTKGTYADYSRREAGREPVRSGVRRLPRP